MMKMTEVSFQMTEIYVQIRTPDFSMQQFIRVIDDNIMVE